MINKFETIVFVDSTLGYEAIARNKKVIAISCRKDKDKITSPFGFPTNKKKRGFFILYLYQSVIILCLKFIKT